MGDRTATVVIEARSLMREALVSLMESHSYQVICSVGSIADIDRSVLKEEQPELVLLGALPTGPCGGRYEQHPQTLARRQDHHAF